MKSPLARISADHPMPAKPIPRHERADMAEVLGKIAEYKARQAAAESRYERAKQANRTNEKGKAAAPARSAIERADMLVGGGTIPSADPVAEMRAASEESRVLTAGLMELEAARFDIASRANFEASSQYRERHVAAIRRLDGAIGDAWAAISDMLGIASELTTAGYDPHPEVLAANLPSALYKLGDPDGAHGEAPRFRQWARRVFGSAR